MITFAHSRPSGRHFTFYGLIYLFMLDVYSVMYDTTLSYFHDDYGESRDTWRGLLIWFWGHSVLAAVDGVVIHLMTEI